MLGAIIGDIVGSRFEFNPTNNYNFELFGQGCSFTDDTVCTIAVADALLKGKDFGESLHEWCRRYPHPMGGYGGRILQWVLSNEPQPYNSFGNGSAMRVGPVAYWYKDKAEMLAAAAATAAPTHNHQEGIKGAQTVALAVFTAMEYNRHHPQEASQHIDGIISECVAFSGYDINIPKASVLNKFDESCQGTVPVALKIISISRSFEEAIRLAVSLGADADTLAAIVGSIAEPIWGIPPAIVYQAKTYLPDEMKDVLEEFYEGR
ncbi:MAG: ADP-ribosylglycohydrolase family protein [Bacteroidales bacterium]|nr:ADP-ribosylglycohydrolase family protein [Candidatus Egerieousia equi]